MLRITRHLQHALRLEGRLTRHEVGLLSEVFRSAANAVAVVDLTSLVFLDEAGAAALLDLERRGLEIRGGSAFVRQLLEEVAS
jgi:ABC-type transporter Mla MlaB component